MTVFSSPSRIVLLEDIGAAAISPSREV